EDHAKLATLRLVHCQCVSKFQRATVTTKLAREKSITHIWPLCERNIEAPCLGRTGNSDLAIRQVILYFFLLLPIPATAFSVSNQDDLVSPDDFFIAEADRP